MTPRTGTNFQRLLSSRRLCRSEVELPSSGRLCHYPRRHIVTLSKTVPFTVRSVLHGRSGKRYDIQEIISQQRDPSLCVYRASADAENFVLKTMIPGEFEYQQALQSSVASCPNLRTPIDTIPAFDLFVYRFLAGHLLHISQKPLSEATRKSILKSALSGLVALHEKGIIHTDIKPNNILIDYKDGPRDEITIHSVQVSDLEDTVILPPGKNLKGCLCGNQFWRSPESWARARQNTPSDVFSFGVMTIYVMLNDMIFRISDDELNSKDAWRHILRRHISFFGDETGFKGLLQHIGEDNTFFQRLIDLAADFDADRPRTPFALWQYVDSELRDLITKMTNLDPARRITAREALMHPWFHQAGSY
ncbi:kinase-like protein [Colletotrichum zoysiae]|uniref:Kinase-like protein n=1 Tax=Colletotrichum zoysiae TaxID=1216348 RepID=A0AAD9HV81_9PEZI|nr:kinase-like protein [Colletotrichum zoysiae]